MGVNYINGFPIIDEIQSIRRGLYYTKPFWSTIHLQSSGIL